MINKYKRRCKYTLKKLDNSIYLYYFQNKIDYEVDAGKGNGICSSLGGNAFQLYCEEVTLESISSSDNRYVFQNKLNIKISERFKEDNTDIIENLLNNEYRIVFKDREGNKYVLNPEFPITMTYSYNVTDSINNSLDITFLSLSNIPVLSYVGEIIEGNPIRLKKCEYSTGKNLKLQMSSIYDTFFSTNDAGQFVINQKGIGIQDIEYNKGSLTFKEEYNGEEWKQTLTFAIPFDNYMFYFHWNLLEYIRNKYYVLLTTDNDNLIIGGYHQGMFPEYNIKADDGGNIITFTLTSIYKNYNLLTKGEKDVIDNKEDLIQFVPLFGECVDGVYTHTLLQKKVNGELILEYYCLSGFQDKYSGSYNIVGTYLSNDSSFGIPLTDINIKCDDTSCKIDNLPGVINFKQVDETITYYITTNCDITLEYDNSNCTATYTPNDRALTIINKLAQGEYIIKVKLSDGTSRNIYCYANDDNVIRRTVYATGQAQQFDVPITYPVSNVLQVTSSLSHYPNMNGTGYYFELYENASFTDHSTYIITIDYNDGKQEIITIDQDKRYRKLIEDGTTQCIDNDLYSMVQEFIGYTPDKIDIFNGYIKNNLIESNSTQCLNYASKEIIGTLCINKVLFNKVKYLDKDGNQVGDIKLEREGSTCDDSTTKSKWVLNNLNSVCVNGVAYYKEDKYYSDDNVNWYLSNPVESRTSNTVAPDSTACENINPDDTTRRYRWYNSGDTVCLYDDQAINCEQEEIVEYIPGDSSTYMCDGYNKYSIIKVKISSLCDNNYQYIGDKLGELIEENSEDCGLVPEYRWTPDGYKCVGYDKFQRLIEEKSVDGGITWNPTGNEMTGYLMEHNSTDCGYIPPEPQYRWVFKENVCKGFDKYKKEIEEKSLDDGLTWNPTGQERETLIEANSKDCGYIPPQYRWVESGTMCVGVDKYVKEIEEKSTDDGLSWIPTGKERQGSLVEENSTDCGYIPPTPGSDELAFEYDNSTNLDLVYKLNHTKFTATTTPYSTTLTELGITDLTICYEAFYKTNLTKLTNFPNTSNVTRMEYMFDGCSSLTSVNLSNFNTSNVTNMSWMFGKCTSLTSLDLSNFDTSKVTSMYHMFSGCKSLSSLDLSNFNTSNVTDMSWMFDDCYSLPSLDVSSFDTQNVTDMRCMFTGCTSLPSLDVSSFDTQNVTDMSYMFEGCSKLQTLDLSSFDTSKVTSMYHMFSGCKSLSSLDLSNFNTSNVTSMYGMFVSCTVLSTLDLSNWDLIKVTSVNMMFKGDTKLTTIYMRNCSQETIDKIKSALAQTGIPSGQVTIVTQ